MEAGVGAALAELAGEPATARLLCGAAPLEASSLATARRLLISRLAALLRRARGGAEDPPRPANLDERMIDATLAFLHTRLAAGEADTLAALTPELTAILGRELAAPRRRA